MIRMAQEHSLLGIYRYLDDLLSAIGKVREGGLQVQTVYSPCPRHEILEAMKVKPSGVRFFTLTGGILGVLSGVALLVFTCLQWKFIVSGKPIVPYVPAVVVGFEFCILLSVLFNVAGFLIKSRLPRLTPPDAYDDRLSQDHFGLVVRCSTEESPKAMDILKNAGAEVIHEVEH